MVSNRWKLVWLKQKRHKLRQSCFNALVLVKSSTDWGYNNAGFSTQQLLKKNKKKYIIKFVSRQNFSEKLDKNLGIVFFFSIALYIVEWYKQINQFPSGKLQVLVYSLCKSNFCFEKYLTLVENSEMRIIFARLHISYHWLQIEIGRHQGICTKCSLGAVEDETHFLFDCSKYQEDGDSLMLILYGTIRTSSCGCLNAELLKCLCIFILKYLSSHHNHSPSF